MSPLLFTAMLAVAPAQADDALRVTIVSLLSGVEDPVRAEELRALPGDVGAELLALAGSGPSTATRERAAYALGWFPTEAHRSWLATTLADRTAPSGLRRNAAWALANGWGEGALDLLAPALADEDVQLRAQVARALARVGTPACRAAIEARLGVESNAMVRSTLNTALGVK